MKKSVEIIKLKLVREGALEYNSNDKMSSSEAAAELFAQFIADSPEEIFAVACLSTKLGINSIQAVSIGNLDSAPVHPREVFKAAILSNSAGIVVAHNHPSGICDPSDEDLLVTRRLKEAGELLGIKLLDHLIISNDGSYVSLNKLGYL